MRRSRGLGIAIALLAVCLVGLEGLHLSPYDVARQGDLLTFQLCRYISHSDPTDLYAALLDAASAREGWHMGALPASDCPFLAEADLPAGTVFEAWYAGSDGLTAFFDADDGLFILRENCP